MIIKPHKHVVIKFQLEVGDIVKTKGWGYKLYGKEWTITEIKEAFGKCQSGFLVKIDGYDSMIDSDWLDFVRHSKS